MRVRWTDLAERDLDNIGEYWFRRDPGFAVEAIRRITDAASSLRDHPFQGRPAGKGRAWRELVVLPTPYLIAYRVVRSEVIIARVWHGAQNRNRRPGR